MRVGIIGVGQIGTSVGRRMLGAGHEVSIYDVRAEAMRELESRGARVCASPADLAAGCELICLAVLDDAQVEDALLGPGGAVEAPAADRIAAIHSTVRTSTVLRVAAAAAERGLQVIDAGVAGGHVSADRGEMVVTVGGPEAAYERVRPVFESFSHEVIHAGPLSAGMALKLVKNHISYAVMAASHEGMLLARRAGIGPEAVRRVVERTGLLAQFFEPPLLLENPERHPADASAETVEHALKYTAMAHKDLDAVTVLGRELGLDLPVALGVRRAAANYFRLPEALEDELS